LFYNLTYRFKVLWLSEREIMRLSKNTQSTM